MINKINDFKNRSLKIQIEMRILNFGNRFSNRFKFNITHLFELKMYWT